MSTAFDRPHLYAYRAFGLLIHSELAFPDLAADKASFGADRLRPDLVIRFGETAGPLLDVTARGARFEASVDHFRLIVDGQARFQAAHGREIIIALDDNASLEAVRLIVLDCVIGAVLHQRGVLPLHASAIQVEQGAVLLMGASGAGKSTLAAALALRGHPIICDDIAAIALEGGSPFVQRGAQHLKLWADAAVALGQNVADLRRARPGLEKYLLETNPCPEERVPLVKAFVLSTSNSAELTVEAVRGAAKVTTLVAQTFRPSLLGDPDSRQQHLAACLAVANHVPICNIVRSRLPVHLKQMIRVVESGEFR